MKTLKLIFFAVDILIIGIVIGICLKENYNSRKDSYFMKMVAKESYMAGELNAYRNMICHYDSIPYNEDSVYIADSMFISDKIDKRFE